MTSVLAALVNGGILSALVTVTVWLALRATPRRALVDIPRLQFASRSTRIRRLLPQASIVG